MDPDALRIEKIRMAVALAEGRAQSYGRFYSALGAVAFAASVSAVAAGLAGQIRFVDAVLLAAALAGFGAWTARQVRGLADGVAKAYDEAFLFIDRLMPREGESSDDGEAADPSGT